jgi:hypothetical protein
VRQTNDSAVERFVNGPAQPACCETSGRLRERGTCCRRLRMPSIAKREGGRLKEARQPGRSRQAMGSRTGPVAHPVAAEVATVYRQATALAIVRMNGIDGLVWIVRGPKVERPRTPLETYPHPGQVPPILTAWLSTPHLSTLRPSIPKAIQCTIGTLPVSVRLVPPHPENTGAAVDLDGSAGVCIEQAQSSSRLGHRAGSVRRTQRRPAAHPPGTCPAFLRAPA